MKSTFSQSLNDIMAALKKIDSLAFNKKTSKKAWLISGTIHLVFFSALVFATQQASSFSSDDRSSNLQNPSVVWTEISQDPSVVVKQPVVKKVREPVVKPEKTVKENKSQVVLEKSISAPAEPTDTFLLKPIQSDPVPSQVAAATTATATTNHSNAPKSAVEMPDTLPSTDASYLNNPKPKYPALSVRLREQGTVMLQVCVSAEGRLDSVSLAKTSGYSRLDQSALDAVQNWRFVPARRGAVTIAQCYQLPVRFNINDVK